MDFGVSSNFSASVGAVKVSKVNTINYNSGGNDNEREIDYSDVIIDSFGAAQDPAAMAGAAIGKWLVERDYSDLIELFDSLNDERRKNFEKSTNRKFLLETGAYVFTKTYGADVAKLVYNWFTSGKGSSTGATVVTSFVSGYLKLIFGIASGKVTDSRTALAELLSGGFGKDAIKGFSKVLTDNIAKTAYKQTLARLSKVLLPGQAPGVVDNMIKSLEREISRTTNVFRVGKDNSVMDLIFKAGISKSAAAMTMGTGIDYVASVVTTSVSALLKGDLEVSSFDKFASSVKLGENLLISSYKTVFGIAFERMFTFLGPAGMKFGKTIGTVVGASVGNFWVSSFDGDEEWCAHAGVATVVGAVGGIWAGAAIASSISATIPVAGWIVGAAIIAGATIATGVVYIFYWFSDDRVENETNANKGGG